MKRHPLSREALKRALDEVLKAPKRLDPEKEWWRGTAEMQRPIGPDECLPEWEED